MSNAKWCDAGGHAFSANDINAQQLTLTKQVGNQWGGAQPYSQTQDICSEHAEKMGLIEKVPTDYKLGSGKAIAAAEEEAEESEAAMWKARYEAERARRLSGVDE